MINFLTKIGYFPVWASNQLYAFPGKLYTLLCHLFKMSASLSDPIALINVPLVAAIVGFIFTAVFESVHYLINLRKSLTTEKLHSSDYKLISTTVVKDGFHSYTQKCWMKVDDK